MQDWDAGPTQAAPPHAGDGFVQARVCVPGRPQALAEHALHADQPPSTRAFAVHERNDGPEQALPPQPGAGLVQVRVCLPVPQLAEQLLHADQPPSRAEAPVQARVSLVPRVPSSFGHSWPPCSGDGLSQLRVCVPLPPQAVAEQALQSDQPPSTAMNLRHLSEFVPPCRPSQRHRYALEVSAIASSLAVPAEQPLRTLSSHAPFTGMNLRHLSEFAPPCRPSQRHRYALEVSAIAASLAVPAEQPLRTLSSHAPSTGMDLRHLSEFAPPCRPSQRHRYALEVSAIAASLAVPAKQPLRTLSSHAPSTGMNLKHFSELAPPCRPSQRQRWAFEMSGTAPSLAVPAEQPLRTFSSHTPSTGMNLWHFSESAPPCRPSQRQR